MTEPVKPSWTVVPLGVIRIATTVVSTVVMVVVVVPTETPLPVMVTDSDAVFASDTPVKTTVCGTFQLDELKTREAGERVIAKVLPETRFTVRLAPGFPDSATERTAVPFSFTEVAPVKTGFESLSAVSMLKLADVALGAVAVIETVSLVSFTS
ncbi:MAG TPA: hypothetical protein PK153_25850, partial [Leptospiraceae bacterium]|nr:hypothetical protein [Leptospiraceae bacterium]